MQSRAEFFGRMLWLLQEYMGVDVVSFYAVLFFLYCIYIFIFLNIFFFYKYYSVYVNGLAKRFQ